MQYQSEILRFQEGARSPHPSPDATIASARPGMLSEVGDQIAVLVDLKPQLPYRSREIRSLAVKTYWASSGSSVARLRRALAAANRHLVRFNEDSSPGSKCSGSVTCAVFSGEELFLGQVGPAYAFVLHQPRRTPVPIESAEFELYPHRDRLLVPLGGVVPPIIHIDYTPMYPHSTVLLATTLIAESQARELWRKSLASSDFHDLTQRVVRGVTGGSVSGTAVLIRALSDAASTIGPRSPSRSFRRFTTGRARSAEPALDGHDAVQAATLRPKSSRSGASRGGPAQPAATPARSQETRRREGTSAHSEEHQRETKVDRQPTARAEGAESAPKRKGPQVSIPTPSLPKIPVAERIQAWIWRLKRHRELMRKQQSRESERSATLERERLQRALQLLLPVQVEGVSTPKQKPPPAENPSVMGGVALGLILLVFLISLTKFLQLGGPLKAEELLAQAKDVREEAYASQSLEDWRQLEHLSKQVAHLDPQRNEAVELQAEAEQAIEALESAAVLNVHPLLQLGTSPKPRRLLVAKSWVYVLDTASDEVKGLRLNEDYISTPSESGTTILKRGDAPEGQEVLQLIDFAWVDPGGSFHDGALLIYGEGGSLYIYEPTLGPGSVTHQKLDGELPPGSVTAIETYGEHLYLLQRADNQILVYEPVNGVYRTPLTYFSAEQAPSLRLALDVAIDGRIYLLMGDGSIKSYFSGTYDPSFEVDELSDPRFMPMVMAMEPDQEEGLVYLGDSRLERITVVDKRGEFKHQFRLPGGGLRQIEALAVSEEPHVLFLVAENRIYAAKLPDFVEP